MTTDRIDEIVPSEDMQTLIQDAQSGVWTIAGLAIHGGNVENMLTANVSQYSIGRQCYTLAAAGEIDISALTGGGGTVADGATAVLLVLLVAAGTISFVQSADYTNASGDTIVVPDYDRATYACIGAVKIKNETGSEWIFGTDNLSEASITDTYYNLNSPFPGDATIFGTA